MNETQPVFTPSCAILPIETQPCYMEPIKANSIKACPLFPEPVKVNHVKADFVSVNLDPVKAKSDKADPVNIKLIQTVIYPPLGSTRASVHAEHHKAHKPDFIKPIRLEAYDRNNKTIEYINIPVYPLKDLVDTPGLALWVKNEHNRVCETMFAFWYTMRDHSPYKGLYLNGYMFQEGTYRIDYMYDNTGRIVSNTSHVIDIPAPAWDGGGGGEFYLK